MVHAAQAAAAIQLATEVTALSYETTIEGIKQDHRTETTELRAENAKLRDQNCELQDDLQELQDHFDDSREELATMEKALHNSRTEIAMLETEKPNVQNFVRAMTAERRLKGEQLSVELLRQQLSVAHERIEAVLKEQAKERRETRHASEAISQVCIEEGSALREQLTTKASARKTLSGASAEPMTELTPQHVNRLAQHIEAVLFGAGRGDLERTQLLLAAVLDRPCVQRLLGAGAPQSLKAIACSKVMLQTARQNLAQLSAHSKQDDFDKHGRRNDHRGTRSAHAQLAFETLVTGLIPDDATEHGMLRTVALLLGLNHDQVKRAVDRKRRACWPRPVPRSARRRCQRGRRLGGRQQLNLRVRRHRCQPARAASHEDVDVRLHLLS